MATSKQTAKQTSLSWSQQFIPLLLLLIVGLVIVYFVPKIPNNAVTLFHKSSQVTTHEIFALVLLAAATVIFLSYYAAKSSFSRKWLIWATIYNGLILLIKFTLSSNEINKGSTRDISTIASTALIVSCLYILGLVVVYLLFEGKLISKELHKKLVTTRETKVLLVLFIFILVSLGRIIIYHLPGVKDTAAANYLGDIFRPKTMLLSTLIFLIIFSCVEAFGQVRRKIDLTYFFVTAFSLVLIFHIWWSVFIYRAGV